MSLEAPQCQELLDELKNEIGGSNNTDIINKCEQNLANNISIVYQLDSFYDLPLKNIQSIISQTNADDITNYNQVFSTIIEKTAKNHSKEEQFINLISSIPCNKTVVSVGDCINIISKFPNIPLISVLNQLYQEEMTLAEVDYSYELSKKDEEIQKLKEQIKNLEHVKKPYTEKSYEYRAPPLVQRPQFTPPQPKNPNIKKPFFFEPDIFKAVAKDKLSSVKYHIEHDNVNVNLKNGMGKSLLMIAQENNYPDIVSYLKQQGAIDYTSSGLFSGMNEDNDRLKFIFVGDINSKKAQLISGIVGEYKEDSHIMTMGIDFKIYRTQIHNHNYKIYLWDTAGQERFKTISKSYYRGAQAILFTFDPCNRNTFTQVQKFIDEARNSIVNGVQMVLVGVNLDGPDYCQVPKEEAEEFIKMNGLSRYFEVSPRNTQECQQMISQIVIDCAASTAHWYASQK